MEKSTVVQILAKGVLDKSLNGCVGFVKSENDSMVTVSIYHPQDVGHNAFVKDFEIPKSNIFEIGTPQIKPV